MNEVEIVVTSTDNTDAGFRSARAKATTLGNDLKNMFTKAGGDGATGFGVSFSQRIGPLLARAPIGPGLAGAIAAATPVVVPAMVSLISLGAAGGAVALGAAISAQNPAVAAGLQSLKDHISSELRISAQPFVPAMLDSIQDVKDGFRTLRPELDATFAKASGYLDPLVEGGMAFVENALPGFRRLVEAAEPLVDILGEELPELGEDFAVLMEDIAAAASESGDEFRAILDTLGLIVSTSGNLLPLFTETNGVLELWNRNIEEANGRIEGAKWVDPIEENRQAFENLNEQLEQARDLATDFADAMDRIAEANLSAAEAQLKYKDQLKDTTEALDGKKGVNDAEADALIDLARAANNVTRAMEDQGASVEEVSDRHQQLRRDFINAAVAAGHTRAQAERLADQYLKIPRTVRTNVQANTEAARREVAAYRDLLASIRRNITTSFNVDVNGNAQYFRGLASGGIAGAQGGGIRSNMMWVGERGPELLALPPGTHVNSNPDSRRMAAGGMGGVGNFVVEVLPAPGASEELMSQIVQGLIFRIRTQGQSDPQTYLSGR